ncbi:Sister chromatid cohesion protein DCC1 [Mortierella sp. GBA43]|nr:Sister chromatid cohesion protein DCC1 [Mortierella sp. GBA43]
MSNPSTQPPSNARTTDVIFPRDFVQSSYMLLEVPKSLESYINNTSENGVLSFQVRGTEKDTAVLCTSSQTFALQRAHTSNMLIPIAPVIRQEKHGMNADSEDDMDMDMDDDPYSIHGLQADDSPYEKQAVLDILDSVLDLSPVTPRLERLAELLGGCQFEGWAQEAQVKASDKEILQWLKDRHACRINGYLRLFKRRFMYDILQEILMTIKILGMSADAIHGDTLCSMIKQEAPENESGIGTWMVEHCLASFSEEEHCLMSFWDEDHSSTNSKNVEQIEEQTMKPEYYRLSTRKVATFMGLHLLSTIERVGVKFSLSMHWGSRWKLEEFVHVWEKSLHEHFHPDLAYLAGECIVEADRVPDRNQTVRYIRYFSKSHLPIDPAARFTALFEIKSKWESQEIRPFLRDLVLDDKKLDVMLLKHARSVKQPDGGVIYSSRVIK